MKRLLVVLLVVLTTPVLARPRIAVTPVSGSGGKDVEKLIIGALSRSATVVKPKETGKAMDRLGLSGELDGKGARQLRKKLDVSVIVQGRIKKSGDTLNLRINIAGRDGDPKAFTLQYKSAKSDKFKKTLERELDRRVAAARGRDDKRVSARDDDDRKKSKKKSKKKKKKKKRTASADDDGDDEGDDGDGDDEGDDDLKDRAKAAGRMTVRVDAGGAFGVRRLTYGATTPPPRLGTASASVHVEGEIYPLAGNPRSPAAGLGIAGEYDKTFGLSIAIPGMNESAPIDKQHFEIGGRYRFGVGELSTIALGLDLVKSRYVADRTGLMAPTDLDAPDVDYTAIAPGLGFRTPLAPKAAVFGAVRGLLFLDTGPIQKNDSLGAATVYGVGVDTGVDIGLGSSLALRLAGDFQQINFTFKGTGTRAIAGGITSATDRNFGLSATLGMTY